VGHFDDRHFGPFVVHLIGDPPWPDAEPVLTPQLALQWLRAARKWGITKCAQRGCDALSGGLRQAPQNPSQRTEAAWLRASHPVPVEHILKGHTLLALSIKQSAVGLLGEFGVDNILALALQDVQSLQYA